MISRRFAPIAAVPLALLLAAAAPAGAAGPAETPAAGAESAQFHGHWKLEIFHPNGELDRVVEFDNLFDGQRTVTEILTGQRTPGEWLIVLAAGGLQEICGEDSEPFPCLIVRGGHTDPAPYYTESLTVETGRGGSPDFEAWIDLSGEVVARRDGHIDDVTVRLATCSPETTPQACAASAEPPWITSETSLRMSNRDLSPSEAVSAGQRVVVTVRLTMKGS